SFALECARTLYLPDTGCSVRPNHHLGHPTTTWEGCRLTSQGYETVRARDSANYTNLFSANMAVEGVTLRQNDGEWRRHARAALRKRLGVGCRWKALLGRFRYTGFVAVTGEMTQC